MKVLFYLPVVTPWWFENIVEPLIRRVASIAEVHILAPQTWRNTGVGPEQIQRCRDLTDVNWAIVDDPDHISLRTRPRDRAGLISYVTNLAPDYVLCRSADFDTVQHFPGVVRFLMEVAAAPFDVAACTTSITAEPFLNGSMPTLSTPDRERLDRMITPLWSEMRQHWATKMSTREDTLQRAEIPTDRPVLLLPLEYEHEENFFLQHRVGPSGNRALVTAAAKRVAPGCTLVVTNHPLNSLHLGDDALIATIAKLGRRVILAPPDIYGIPATLALAPIVDGMILGDSKSFGIGACFGTPMVRRSKFASAAWLQCETDLEKFVSSVRAGTARAPDEADARLWFGYHLANEAFYPKDPDLTGEMVIDRTASRVNPDRWEAAIGRVRAVKEAAR